MNIVCLNFPIVIRRRLLKRALRNADNVHRQYTSKQRVGIIDVCHRKESIIAWELVEELSSELHKYKEYKKEPLEIYCEENPDALECRMYDV